MWIHTDECDSLLFSCLYAVATNKEFPVELAFWDELWHRRPEPCGECSSTISRDMFMGLFAYCLHFRRIDILDEISAYGWKHCWKMGIETKAPTEVRIGPVVFHLPNNRVWFTPGLVALLQQLRTHLRGKKSLWRFLPQSYSSEPGYVSHLTMLHIYMNARMRGFVSAREKTVLHKMLSHSDSNPLLHALLGERAKTLELLARWPTDRLPNNYDWEEPWLTQRDDSDSGHLPAPPNTPVKEHSGGDALFVRHVLGLDI